MGREIQGEGLDSFTRRYLYVLAAVLLAGFAVWLSSLDFRASELNEMLEADAELAAYPYKFRVLSLKQGVAQMSSPRSARMSALQGLRVMFPELKTVSVDSPQMTEAQSRLAQVQSRAAQLVMEQEDVQRVSWVLDERWLSNHGISLQ
jgi:hypothetical protein